VTRQTGSHIRLTTTDEAHHITIPNHNPIKVGTPRSILRDIAGRLGKNWGTVAQELFDR
jgi:predicted RNA binding protein YcfA (HicA-like mRNA interferase family)